MVHFKDITLGRASAELEGAYHPELIVDGFLDPWDVVGRARNGPEFLFLGYKGSGKSAIGEHLRLTAENNYDLFVTHTFLSDFPYGNFTKIVTGDAEPESRLPSAWQWLLTLTLLDSISKDHGAFSDDTRRLERSLEALKSIGLLPSTDLKKMVVASSRVKYRAKLPGILDIELEPNQRKPDELQFLHIISRLQDLLMTVRSDSKHLLILDGLDDIFLQKEIQYKSIAALIFEAARLNQLFSQNDIPAKVIVLCRTELFERLPGPNKNKIRQDSAIELDWYRNPSRPETSMLVRLVNKRACLADEEIKDMFTTFFPREWHNQPFLTFLLNHTRHTPRDFIQLLIHIQECSTRRGIENKQISAGIRNYSSKYFLPEIRDELVGYLTQEQVDALIRGISRAKRSQFDLGEISEHLRREGLLKQADMPTLLEPLFDCSAIGNLRKDNRNNVFLSFRFRNRHSHLKLDEEIVVHRGLWRAMNIY